MGSLRVQEKPSFLCNLYLPSNYPTKTRNSPMPIILGQEFPCLSWNLCLGQRNANGVSWMPNPADTRENSTSERAPDCTLLLSSSQRPRRRRNWSGARVRITPRCEKRIGSGDRDPSLGRCPISDPPLKVFNCLWVKWKLPLNTKKAKRPRGWLGASK